MTNNEKATRWCRSFRSCEFSSYKIIRPRHFDSEYSYHIFLCSQSGKKIPLSKLKNCPLGRE